MNLIAQLDPSSFLCAGTTCAKRPFPILRFWIPYISSTVNPAASLSFPYTRFTIDSAFSPGMDNSIIRLGCTTDRFCPNLFSLLLCEPRFTSIRLVGAEVPYWILLDSWCPCIRLSNKLIMIDFPDEESSIFDDAKEAKPMGLSFLLVSNSKMLLYLQTSHRGWSRRRLVFSRPTILTFISIPKSLSILLVKNRGTAASGVATTANGKRLELIGE
mmetsp:Transcript_9475/g.10796  ORF Transcript_9475/g.10796 Transcript_9475/m.10796 type:complete len:215 (+) Transcript_9475:2253-2897(+)